MNSTPDNQPGNREFGLLMVALCFIVGVLLIFYREPNYHARSLNSWLNDLSATDPYRREAAKDAIREMGADALPHLIKNLGALDAHTQVSALLAVEVLGHDAQSTAPIIVVLLRHEQTSTEAARALASIGPAAVPLLSKELFAPVNFVRRNAAFALGLMQASAREAIPALIAALNDNDERVRYHAARSLGQIAREPALCVPALVECLDDKSDGVREIAVRALGHFHQNAASAVPALRQALVTGGPKIQGTIVITLREIDRGLVVKDNEP